MPFLRAVKTNPNLKSQCYMIYQLCKEFGGTPSSRIFRGVCLSAHEQNNIDWEVLVKAREFEDEMLAERESLTDKMNRPEHPGQNPMIRY